MSTSLKPLQDQVIVITGASSGIGLATARAAVNRGAKVVLAARNEEALATIARELTAAGGQVLPVAADVGRREEVERIASAAVERFGGFDTWVNDAGVGIIGPLDAASDEDNRRMFDTNFWGVVYGSLVAVAHLKGRGGALINLGSVASDISLPLQGMYSASKHAIKGFTDALRMELEHEGAPISVTLIKPASIDTPYPQHAMNYTDKEPKLPPPVYAPEEVANAILHAAAHPRRDLYVGGGGKMMSASGGLLPRLTDLVAAKTMVGLMQRDESPRDPAGALHRAGDGGQVRGDHPGIVWRPSIYTRATLHPAISTGALAAVGAAAAAWRWSGRARPAR